MKEDVYPEMIELLKHLNEYRRDAVLTPVLVALETVGELFLTLTIGRFIDELSASGTGMDTIWAYGLRLLLFALLCLVLGTVAGLSSTRAAAGLSRNLRDGMFSRIQDFSFANIDKFSTNSLVTRMTTDVMNVQNAVMMILRVAAKAPISIVCALIMAFATNWQIGLLYLVVIPVLFCCLMVIARVTHPIFRRVFKTYDRLNGVVRENLHGIRVVKGFVREDYEAKKFRDISGDIRRDFTKAEATIAFNPFLMQMGIYTCLTLIAWLGAKAIVGSSNGTVLAGIPMTTGELQNLITYSMMILMSLMMLSMIYVMLMMSRESVSRIREILSEQPGIAAPERAATEIRDGEIVFEHVGFSYVGDAGRLCLSDIDLRSFSKLIIRPALACTDNVDYRLRFGSGEGTIFRHYVNREFANYDYAAGLGPTGREYAEVELCPGDGCYYITTRKLTSTGETVTVCTTNASNFGETGPNSLSLYKTSSAQYFTAGSSVTLYGVKK